jgi:hypothetical protein
MATSSTSIFDSANTFSKLVLDWLGGSNYVPTKMDFQVSSSRAETERAAILGAKSVRRYL